MKNLIVVQRLIKKTEDRSARMPSISDISKMLTSFEIEHNIYDSVNVVERTTRGRRYVNSRHLGKEGKRLQIPEARIYMDSSESYYSWNTVGYAEDIIAFLKSKNKI